MALSEHNRNVILFEISFLIIGILAMTSIHFYRRARLLQKQRAWEIERGALKSPLPSLTHGSSFVSSRALVNQPQRSSTDIPPLPSFTTIAAASSASPSPSSGTRTSIRSTPPPTAYTQTFWYGKPSSYPYRPYSHPTPARRERSLIPRPPASSNVPNPSVLPGVTETPEAHVRRDGDVRRVTVQGALRTVRLDVSVGRTGL